MALRLSWGVGRWAGTSWTCSVRGAGLNSSWGVGLSTSWGLWLVSSCITMVLSRQSVSLGTSESLDRLSMLVTGDAMASPGSTLSTRSCSGEPGGGDALEASKCLGESDALGSQGGLDQSQSLILRIPYNKSLLYFTRGLYVPITGKTNRHFFKIGRFAHDFVSLRTISVVFRTILMSSTFCMS